MTGESTGTEGLVMEIAGRKVRFLDAGSFDFALQPRAHVSLEAQAWLEALTPEDIHRERAVVRRLRRWLDAELPRRVSTSAQTGAGALPEETLAMLADEHQWASLLSALIASGPAQVTFMHIALVRFGDYLGERERALVRAHRQATRDSMRGGAPLQGGNGAVHEEDEDPLCTTHDPSGEPPGAETTGEEPDPATPNAWIRLTRGRAETLNLPADEPLHLNCAGVILQLTHSHGRQEGAIPEGRIVLRLGPNVLGRDPACDVVLRDRGNSVSRMHTLVVDHGDGRLMITDLSRNGTFILRANTG